MAVTPDDLPKYSDLLLPTLRVVDALGGSGSAREITERLLAQLGPSDEELALTYDGRPKSILIDRLDWARSYCKLETRNPPVCHTCAGRNRYRAKAAARAAVDAAHDQALREEDLRRAALRTDEVNRSIAATLRSLGPVLGQEWRPRAACLQTPTSIFFDADTTRAAAICATCRVRPECKSWVMADQNQQGFVAGTTEAERIAIRSTRRSA